MASESHIDPSNRSGYVDDGDDDGSVVSDQSSSTKQEEDLQLAKGETRAVNTLRLLVFLVLVAVAALVSLSVFLFTRGTEKDTFETRFTDQAGKVVDAFQANADRRLGALQGFSQQMTSHAVSANETFPFVTLPDFERRASYTLKLADSVAMLIFPIIRGEQRADWEAYSVANQAWLTEGLAVQAEIQSDSKKIDDSEEIEHLQDRFDAGGVVEEGESDTLLNDMQITPVIYRLAPGTADAAPETGNGPYTPIWQLAPAAPISPLINFNTLSHPSRVNELTALLVTGQILISSAADFKDSLNPAVANRKEVMNLFLHRWKDGSFEYEDGPVSDVYIPIWDSNGKQKTLASVLTAYVYWQSFFTNVLPDNANGIIAVLENTCKQHFTYRIDGKNADYIGAGDLHNTKYDDMMVETGFGAYVGKRNIRELDQTLQEVLEGAQCYYNVRVYPSQDMEDDYTTMTPIIFTVVVVSVFLFTSLVFITYDRLVAHRHKVVNKTAVKSTAVVQSLFPEQVRDRLYESNDKKKKIETKHRGFERDESEQVIGGDTQDDRDDMPIADMYPDCTVLFSDIAGFTAWSASRQPCEVFKLLETLYGAFDRIAKRRRVFKVETVGDCYVAVTGLPEVQPNHHIIMVKFASHCLWKMNEVLRSLVPRLGQDTDNLSMRFGLHSGPVTAGVLRGEKARFQLFGDTVNTASRIETNGQRGRIHLSESTAQLLIASGKEFWLEKREDLIQAKGKGEMQTYWVKANLDTTLTSMASSSHDDDDNDDDDDDNGTISKADMEAFLSKCGYAFHSGRLDI